MSYLACNNGCPLSDTIHSSIIVSSEIIDRGTKAVRHRSFAWVGLLVIITVGALLSSGCVPGATIARMDGFNNQWRGFDSLKSEHFSPYETEIKVKVVVVSSPDETGYPNAAGTYSHPEGVIRIVGKMIRGKIILCPAVIGHEFQHALQYQDGHFVDPDKLAEYGY
jgi:hypothetical protein